MTRNKSMTWDISWLFFFRLLFVWYFFPTNLGKYLVAFLYFVGEVFWEKGKMFQWVIWVFLFIDTMLMTLIFLILISGACWNNFWCYKDIWVSFKKIKDNFFVFYLVKLKVAFINTIFWCWIWVSVDTSYFDNLELIEFKGYSAPTCISKSFSNL